MTKERKNKILICIIVLLLAVIYYIYMEYETNSIEGRFSVIKDLKMSDIAGVKK